MHEFIEQFRNAIEQAGITPPVKIECDGKIHRFSSNGRPQDNAGWYLLHLDGIAAGCFGDWRTGVNQNWRADIGRGLSHEEEAEHRNRVREMQIKRQEEEILIKAEAQAKALSIWKKARPSTDTHAYLVKKGIKTHSAKQIDGALVLPLRDENSTLHSLQFINENGEKRFLVGGRVSGCYFSIGSIQDAKVLCIVEGFSTGATIHEATDYPIAVAFNAGNLLAVATVMREKFPELTLILCADDDFKVDSNPGLSRATEAARHINGLLAVPKFDTNRPDDKTDFNDMAEMYGNESVRQVIEQTILSKNLEHTLLIDSPMDNWSKPQPLIAKLESEPYPLDALPDSIREAVEEVQRFTKAPLPLVISSALAALSLAAQTHADAKRAEKLCGPASLFFLTIADSGERKSTCDGFFSKAIRDYEEVQATLAKTAIKDHMAAIDAWKEKNSGIKDKIRHFAKGGQPTADLEEALRRLEHEKPECPKIPRLLYTDATPEALAFSLANNWPSGGIVSAEAGIVFGSHSMNKDSIMRNLALLNILWDGGDLTIDRKTAESFTVRNVRLTVGLQVQEATLRNFFERSGVLARGTGFLARFLVAWPESTQGQRLFTDAPPYWPALEAFNQRITVILNQPLPIEEGILKPFLLPLSAEAKEAWVVFHNAIEAELVSGGELYDVRDVASKTADNAIRLATLFQLFEDIELRVINKRAIESASRIVAWHLNEARRFFGELALPTEMVNAVRLNNWLISYCRKHGTTIIPRREVQRNVTPVNLRNNPMLDVALNELVEADRIMLLSDSRRKEIHLNPALLEMEEK
ncbi:DUF3987 domain-containing protein [Fluoribacter gormanii]|uniref:DUF3987 domain-containing protein n=1 Tax=Fluoribacter gormanii TaxID=464 RepID=UPI001041A480|nr:DUF3987 domain-containing protein [Fluoribacter gormanii]